MTDNGTLYSVVYADPPWRYGFSRSRSRRIENHYATQTVEEICALEIEGRPVSEHAARDAVLFLWVPAPKLFDAKPVMEAWGFRYRTNAVWHKAASDCADPGPLGCGYTWRNEHEHLLRGTRGKPGTPPPGDRPRSVLRSPRCKHSAKPLKFRRDIERMYPLRTRIELYARELHPGWAAWGDDVEPSRHIVPAEGVTLWDAQLLAESVTCEACGRPLAGRRRHARTCSSACRQRAYRQRAVV